MVAFAFTVTAAPTTGKRKGVQSAGPNVTHYEGTWTANGTDVSGTIDLTTATTNLTVLASKILRCEVAVSTGTITSNIKFKPTVDKAGTAADGKIGILLFATDNTGTWWADVVS